MELLASLYYANACLKLPSPFVQLTKKIASFGLARVDMFAVERWVKGAVGLL